MPPMTGCGGDLEPIGARSTRGSALIRRMWLRAIERRAAVT